MVHVIGRVAQLVPLIVLCACGADTQSQKPFVSASDPVVQRAAAEVENYVVKSKNWEKASFQVELNRKDGATLVFWVIHSDDWTATSPGGGKSVEVHVDTISNRVLRELKFQ